MKTVVSFFFYDRLRDRVMMNNYNVIVVWCQGLVSLTYWGLVTHISDSALCNHCFMSLIASTIDVSLSIGIGEIWIFPCITAPVFICPRCQHIEADTKWMPFGRRHFHINFLSQKLLYFLSKFHWNLLPSIPLTIIIRQHWVRWWLGIDQGTSHYLNQWWSSLLTHIYTTRPRRVKINCEVLTHYLCWHILTVIICSNG